MRSNINGEVMDDTKVFFGPIKVKRVSEAVENSIREFIYTKKLNPGDRLPSQSDLSEQFQVSIVTIREALRALETIGLIETRKGKGGGIFISDNQKESLKKALEAFFTWKNITADHLIEARMVIEPYAVRKATQNMSPAEIEELRKNVAYAEEKLNNLKGGISVEDYFDLELNSIDFHRVIAKGTHNPLISLTVDSVMDFLHNFEKIILKPDLNVSRYVANEHKEILALIETGKVDEVEQAMIKHIKHVEEDIWKEDSLIIQKK
jgi:GntR family transcriptional repressor for pyruvate dehydrogenase complex